MLDPVGPSLASQAVDSVFKIIGDVDPTKSLNFQVDTQATASQLTYDVGAQTASRTLLVPVLTGSATLAVLSEAQTFSGAKTFSAVLTVSNATASTTSSTGAEVITGGLGVGGAVNAGGDITSIASATRFAKISGNLGSPTEIRLDDNSAAQAFKLNNGATTGANQGMAVTVGLGDSGSIRASWNLFTAATEGVWSAVAGTQNAYVALQAIASGSAVEFLRGRSTGQVSIGVIGSTFPGNIIAGVQSAAAATAGQVGETSESKISTATNAAATGTYLALTSITLQPGDWDIVATAVAIPNGATVTVNGPVELLVGTTTASNTGTTNGYDRVTDGQPIATGVNLSLAIPAKRVNISVATTYFVNVLATYTVGTPQWQGSISARRAR